MLIKYVTVLMLTALTACSLSSPSESEPVTLYRNSQVDSSMRIHIATFDAEDSGQYYNLVNCRLASKVLNANVEALNPGKEQQTVGFWCEEGNFEKEGQAVTVFDAKFPFTTER